MTSPMNWPNARSKLGLVARHAHRGVSLIFALIALAVLSLATVALVRSVDTGTLVLGNLGFKKDATASADQAVDQAIAYVASAISGAALDANQTSNGYRAAMVNLLDASGNNPNITNRAVIDWNGDGCSSYPSGTYTGGCLTPVSGSDVNGNKTQYFINRLCPSVGPANTAGNDCSVTLGKEGESNSRGAFNYRQYERFKPQGSGSTYFRVIVRVVGGRNAASYVETIVHF